MEKKEFYKLFKKIPKTEIHLHSEAVVNKQDAQIMLSRDNPKYKDKNEIDKLFNVNNLEEFINVFLLLQRSFKTVSDFGNLFHSISQYMKMNGLVYAELFFAPTYFIKQGWKYEEMVKFFSKKIKKIKRKDNITIKLLVDVSRTFGAENAMTNLELVNKYKTKDIIGIGLGGDEKKGPAKDYIEVYKKARDYGLHRVAHAGEDDTYQSIWDSIRLLKIERIGHGIAAVENDEIMEYLVKEQIPLEISPTSNVFTKKYVKELKDHPVKKFYDKGILVTLNTDDPTLFNINIIDEYWNLYSEMGFSLDDLKQIVINGFKATFLPKKKKQEYINRLKRSWKKYFSNKK